MTSKYSICNEENKQDCTSVARRDDKIKSGELRLNSNRNFDRLLSLNEWGLILKNDICIREQLMTIKLGTSFWSEPCITHFAILIHGM